MQAIATLEIAIDELIVIWFDDFNDDGPAPHDAVLDVAIYCIALLPVNTAAVLVALEALRTQAPVMLWTPFTIALPDNPCVHTVLDFAITCITALNAETNALLMQVLQLRYALPDHACCGIVNV
ncbi:hypothetical protein SDRG_13371 [Saprolegnia diclina VS20]|uniref:Uncharacterized protein n=1 Tax=Saprolegnia diclina (strain VS20) TaxID=1156394 RepID=T0PTN0_SAPDV|nr:hypothetical protein SDRG_13371 [Saprolegnia diclina VS20]EQC28859.1 hypothetical protein SDRG_13371 [Saprolegnia diclina VS20]|eukprot:XP_008617676.1 hypothetical protein SDRG_13371 [Saprolegnia diclina VS20]